MIQRILAATAPGVILIILAFVLDPFDLGYLGLLLAVASLLLAVAGAFLVRPEPEEPETPETRVWRVLLVIVGVIATGVVWYRVWSYDSWHISMIPIPVIYAFGFWWPGLLVAAAAWALAGAHVERSLRRYASTLAIGLVAGAVGAGAYQSTHAFYLNANASVPIAAAVNHVTGKVPGGADWSHRVGHLSIVLHCDWATEAPPYTVYSCLKQVSKGAGGLLKRPDVAEVTVQARAAGAILFSGEATDAAPEAVAGWLDRLDRTLLKDGGALDARSLDEMVYASPPEFVHDANRPLFEETFKYGISGNEVVIGFSPGSDVSVGNVDLYAAAYRSANRIVRETAAYFLEIEAFQVDLAGYRRTVTRDEAVAETFFLQNGMVPQDCVVGLITKARASTSATLEPASFQAPEPLEGCQIAAVVTLGRIEEHTVGRIFEEISLKPGRLYVTGLATDGTVTVFVVPEEGEPAGPVDIGPTEEGLVADQWVTNLGLIPRSDFAAAAS